MPLDAYSFCPGGIGKKIKFCCSDLVGELEKISRLREAGQQSACLEHLQRLEQKHPGRACLRTLEADVLRELGRRDEAEQVVQGLLAEEQDNPAVLAEAALIAVEKQGALAAIPLLQGAWRASGERIVPKLYEALGETAVALLNEGRWMPGLAHLVLLLNATDRDDAMQILGEIWRLPTVPLLMKQMRWLRPAPAGAPWGEEFDAAVAEATRGRWQAALERFQALAERSGDVPEIWFNLALLRSWLADDEAPAAWRRYASLASSLDDAVEAEALAQCLDPQVFGKENELVVLYPVADVDRLHEALLSSPQAVALPADSGDEGEPPPKAAFVLLDRPPPPAQEIDAAGLPRRIGFVQLFGRQTDREARLELRIDEVWLESAQAVIGQAAGELLAAPGEPEVKGEISLVDLFLLPSWHVPRDVSYDRIEALLLEKRRQACFEEVPRLALPALDGQSLEQAAADEHYRVKSLAVILNVELLQRSSGYDFDFNELRARLGLPTSEPVEPDDRPPAEMPVAHLGRLPVERLSESQLLELWSHAATIRERATHRKCSLEMLKRPESLKKAQLSSAVLFGELATTAPTTTEALEYVDQGRQAVVAEGGSCYVHDFAEIELRLQRGEGDDVIRLLNHLQRDHRHEPAAQQRLGQLLVGLGVVTPDGRLIEPSPAPSQPIAAEPARIWTPESERAEKPGLWVPGRD